MAIYNCERSSNFGSIFVSDIRLKDDIQTLYTIQFPEGILDL